MRKKKETKPEPKEGKPNRASFHHGSTTQGGSDFGQGSMQMGRYGNAQGSESNDGANYDGEQGWDNEALRRTDIRKVKKKE